MQDYSKTPYKTSMENAKKRHPDSENLYTQEKVAELTDKCPGTVFNWFAGMSRPDDASVLKMAKYFDDPELPDDHLDYWEPLFRDYKKRHCLDIENKRLADAAVSMVSEFNDVKVRMDDLFKMIANGKITDDMMKELHELYLSLYGLINASRKQ